MAKSLTNQKKSGSRFRILFAAALLMMSIGHTCPGDSPVRGVVFSVYVPLLFFVFGTRWRLAEKKADARMGRITVFRDALEWLGKGILRDLKEIVLPFFITGLIQLILDIAKTSPEPGMRGEKIGNFFEAVLWSSGVPIEEHGSIGVLWFLTALFVIMLIVRLLSFASFKGKPVLGTVIIIAVSVFAGVEAMILAESGARLALAFDTAMAGLFFFGMGVLYIDAMHFFHRFRYLFAAISLPLWIIGLVCEKISEFAVRNYVDPLYFLTSLCGIIFFVFLASIIEDLWPRAASVIGVPGRYPIFFICLHAVDGLFYIWWDLKYWGINMILRFAVTALLSRIIGHIIQSFKDGEAGRYDDSWMAKKPGDIMFYICFGIAYARLFMNATMFYLLIKDWRIVNRPYDTAVLGLTMLAAFAILKCKDKKLKILWIGMVLLGILEWHRGGPMELFTICLLIVAVAGRRIEPVLIISIVVGSIQMLAAYWCSMNGYLPYLVYDTGRLYGGHAFGMAYRTDLAAHILYMMMSFAILRKEKLRYFGYMGMVFGIWFVWRYTQARANTISMIAFLFGVAIWLLVYVITKKKIQLPRLSALIHAACCAVILLMVFLYKGRQVNIGITDPGTFMTRLSLSIQAFREYPLRLLGTYIEENGAGGLSDLSAPYFFLDITYVRNLLIYGILYAILYMALMTWTSFRAAKEKWPILGLSLIIIAFVSMIEHHAADLSYNVMLLAAFADLSPLPEGDKENFMGRFFHGLGLKRESAAKRTDGTRPGY